MVYLMSPTWERGAIQLSLPKDCSFQLLLYKTIEKIQLFLRNFSTGNCQDNLSIYALKYSGDTTLIFVVAA